MASDDQLFPIDIHYNKLLDWLIDRRHCELKWHSPAREIHDKIRAAVGKLPSTEQFAELTKQEDMNYFLCQKVFELLKSTEGETKNLFGQYNSLILREWSDILKLYEKKNVYLAEGAQQLMRNVNYEIPAVKQQMSKCHQAQRDCQKKEGECSTSAAAFRDKFDASCKEMGIQI